LVGYGVAAAGIISGVMSATKKTKKVATSLGGQSKGGASVSLPTAGTGAQSTQQATPSFNIVGSSETNQLADAIAGQTQEPIQAYVTSNDVTSAQSLDRNIVQEAGLG
jgi:hypothetical protein